MGDTLVSMSNVDGRITPTDEARVPVLDRGFLYGDSIYEVFRTYQGVPLFYDEHWRRLENSASLIQMHISQNYDQMTEEIRRTVQASGAGSVGKDVYVRYMITRGEGPVDLYPNPDLETRYVIVVKEVPAWPANFYEVGMKAAIPAVRRNPTEALDPNIKGGNYLNNVIAITQARQLGADESIILNNEGFVTEASNSNVFFVIEGKLVTPSMAVGNLMGLTKKAVHECCTQKGLEVVERRVHVDELGSASECFVTSATREVMPIASLRLENGRWVEFPPGGGETTRRVSEYYREHVEKHLKENASLCLW